MAVSASSGLAIASRSCENPAARRLQLDGRLAPQRIAAGLGNLLDRQLVQNAHFRLRLLDGHAGLQPRHQPQWQVAADPAARPLDHGLHGGRHPHIGGKADPQPEEAARCDADHPCRHTVQQRSVC